MNKKKKEEEVVKPHLLNNIEKQKLRIKIIADTKKDLKTKPKYKEHFAGYEATSVDSFINRYASRKADFVIHGEMYKKLELDKTLKFIDDAKDYFEMIQHDKLLAFQYQWNEGNIKIEGIESNYDFYPLYNDVFQQKYITPITKEEVNIMHDFIISHNDQGFTDHYYAPNYISDDIIITHEKEGEPDYENEYLPHYYFYKRKKTGEKTISKDSLIRHRKEKHYMDIHYKEQARLRGPYIPHVPEDPRPDLNLYDKSTTRKFILKYEDEKILHFHDAYERENEDPDDMEDKINMAVWHFQDTGEHHPLEANNDWKQSILAAEEKSKKQKTAKALYIVFEEYQQCLSNNIPFMPPTSKKQSYDEIWIKYKENVLHGRELEGEPMDFNF